MFLMQYKTLVACASALLFAGVVACSDNSEGPVSPSASPDGTTGPNNETLKATAPVPQSPTNNQQPQGGLILVASKSTSPHSSSAAAYSYEFEIRRSGNTVAGCTVTVPGGSGDMVSATPNCSLDVDQIYGWRARAVWQGRQGPWSAEATFTATAGGGITDDGVYDPLVNGQTVGEIFGDVTFIPNVGVRLNNHDSHIRYRLRRNITQGEFSIIVTGMATNTEGGKTKVMGMCEAPCSDIVTDDRRMTVEKRGDPEGIVAWRFISHLDQIDTEGAEREFVAFDANQPYLFTATWNGFFNVRIQRGGSNGDTVYSKGKPYDGAYDPEPHWAYIGSPVGRSGPDGATVPGMIVRHVWISSRPRPAGLN
jgi:hypothetical protein